MKFGKLRLLFLAGFVDRRLDAWLLAGRWGGERVAALPCRGGRRGLVVLRLRCGVPFVVVGTTLGGWVGLRLRG